MEEVDPATQQNGNESPRSIDRKETISMSQKRQSPSSMTSINNNNMMPPLTVKVTNTKRREHRRISSDPRYYNQQRMSAGPPPPGYGGTPPTGYGSSSPGYGMQHPPPSPRSMQLQQQGFPQSGQQQQYQQQQRRAPPPGYHQQQRPSHNRTRSWNPPAQIQGLSAAGNPLIPVLQDSSGMVEPQATYSSNNRRKRSHGRARSNSASDYDMRGAPSPAPLGESPRGSSPHNAGGWSPRGEIMGLAKGYSNRTTPPISPNKHQQQGYRNMSPRQSPPSALRQSYGATTARNSNGGSHVQFQAGTTLDHPFSAQASARNLQPWQHDFDGDSPSEMDGLLKNNGGGGEAVYDAQRRSSRRSSSKKMHMRQRSAQIFMEDVKGTPQRPACRDVLFVLLFLFHLVGMLFLGTTYGTEAMKMWNDDEERSDDAYSSTTVTFINDTSSIMHEAANAVTLSHWSVIYVACLCGAFAVVVSTCTLLIMMSITKNIVQLALILTICLSFAWGTIGIGVSPKNFVPITGIIALALSVAYAFVVWDRIPFAASNLHAGLSAVRANIGTVLVAFCFQGLALAWTLYYTFVVIGVYDALQVGDLVLSHNMQIFVFVMLGISYYWTFQVLMNVIQVTVAGTIGSWWFIAPADAEPTFWNQSVSRALFSAIFYSSGSICFGSLLIGPVRLIRQLSAFFRPSQEDSILMCLHECVNCIQQCIAGCVDNLSDHFNPWALTYVGLYGYGLLDAGHNATELFEKRGWSKIVSDDLVTNVLLMFSVVVGGVTGCFGLLIERIDRLSFSSFHEPTITAFSIGLGVGLVLTLVLFSIVSASVNAVIVCFAGSPLEFESNHPQLSTDMRSAWREVWPGCMDVLDMRVGIMSGGPQPIM